jgi:hypothetical protein
LLAVQLNPAPRPAPFSIPTRRASHWNEVG